MVRLYIEAQRAKSVGNIDLAETLFQRAASLDPSSEGLKKELVEIEHSKKSEDSRFVLTAFRARDPLAINFRDAKLRDALKVVCEPYNLNFVFDKNTDNFDVSVSAKNVTFEQAFNMILQSSHTAFKVLGPNSLFVYEDTPEKRKLYADQYFKTFHLSTLKAERMAEIIRASMEVKTLVANNDLGTIQVRESRDSLDVIEKLVAANDRKPAEILLNVEVVELDVSKANQLGIDYGSQVTVEPPPMTLQNLISKHGYVDQSLVTLPSATLNYLKSNTDARTLSNPRVRTVDGQPAKIHVGDKVPLQSASIQDSTGQTRTLYEYHDIGINLDVLPKYHLDDLIFVDLNIEVSTLGNNIGTAAQPAYEIGTRNVHTTMILREGETAVLGGLISEESLHSMAGIPGISGSSIVGRLFSNIGDSGNRTELLLTVTPHLLRPQSLPGHAATDFYSGTENNFSTRASYDYLKQTPTGQPPKYSIDPDNRKPAADSGGWQPAIYGNRRTGDERAQRAIGYPSSGRELRFFRLLADGDGCRPGHSVATCRCCNALCAKDAAAREGDAAARNAAHGQNCDRPVSRGCGRKVRRRQGQHRDQREWPPAVAASSRQWRRSDHGQDTQTVFAIRAGEPLRKRLHTPRSAMDIREFPARGSFIASSSYGTTLAEAQNMQQKDIYDLHAVTKEIALDGTRYADW